LKIRHSAIVNNVVNYVYAKCGDDRLWHEKALADHKSDNNNTKNNKNNVGRHWRSVPGSKNPIFSRTTLDAIGDPFLGQKIPFFQTQSPHSVRTSSWYLAWTNGNIFKKQTKLTFRHPFIWMACILSLPANNWSNKCPINVTRSGQNQYLNNNTFTSESPLPSPHRIPRLFHVFQVGSYPVTCSVLFDQFSTVSPS